LDIMKREDVIKIISEHRDEIKRLGVKSLAFFGSVARNENRPDSDVDFIVDFESKPTFDGYTDLKSLLEKLLSCKIDLATRKSLKPRLRTRIEKEAVYVA